MTEARIFGPEGRYYDEFGVRYPAGSAPTVREDVAYFMTSGEYAVGEWVFAGDIAAALGRDRPTVRAAADALEKRGYLLSRRDASGFLWYCVTDAAVLERNRCRCGLWPAPSAIWSWPGWSAYADRGGR